MRPLIEGGHLYFAQPPLYKITKNKKDCYVYSDEELQIKLKEMGGKDSNVMIQRYKGLGEMDATQLWDTTMNPDTRTLLQVTIDDFVEAEDTTVLLMGDVVEPRKNFIKQNSTISKNLDI